MHCNGHCYFMRKIKEARENENKQGRANQQSHYQEALPAPIGAAIRSFAGETPKLVYPKYLAAQVIGRSYAILIPPKIV